MRTLFSPVMLPKTPPAERLAGVHLDLNGLRITGMTPRRESWGRICFTSFSGWWDAPGTTGNTTQFLTADGGWNDRAYRTPRVMEITGWLDGPDRASVREGIETLMTAIPLDEPRPLAVTEDGLVRHCLVRMSGEPKAEWTKGPALLAEFNIQVIAPDPRKLAGPGGDLGWRVLGPVGLPSTTGGLTFPFTLPTAFTAVTTSGQVALDFAGTAVPNAVVEFTGPVLNPGMREVGTGRTLWFDLELLAGQTLSVDLRTRSVLLNGVSRRGKRRGQWIAPTPGAVWEFTAANYNADARMLVRTQEAWI